MQRLLESGQSLAGLLLLGAVALSCTSESPTSIVTETFEARRPGCGIAIGSANAPTGLISVSLQDLSYAAGLTNPDESSHEPSTSTAFVLVGPLRAINLPHGASGEAVCVVPASSILSKKSIEASLNDAIVKGSFRLHDIPPTPTVSDWTIEALFAEEFKLAEKNGRRLTASSSASSDEATLVRNHVANAGGGGDPFPWHLNAVVVYASPYNHDWFFDTRDVERLWYGLSARDAQFDAQLTYFVDAEAPCEEGSETWIKLEELERLVDDIIARLQDVETAANGFSLQNPCPVELMEPGQSCLDFFIAAETALLGALEGNSRTAPEPYGDISYSKIFVIDNFDDDEVILQLAGTSLGFSVPLPTTDGEWSFVKLEFPPSLLMVDRLEISAPDASTRVLNLSIKNAMCPYIQYGLETVEAGMGEIFDMVCLNIDATVTYVRDARGWVPQTLDRDAFPTLDVFRMNTDRTLEHLWRSDERHWSLLTGFLRLKEEIQAAKDDTPIETGECELQ